MTTREFWQQEAAKMRDKSAVLDKSVLSPIDSTQSTKSVGKFKKIETITHTDEKHPEESYTVDIFKDDVHKVYYFRSRFDVDYDGAPKAYHKDKDKGFDKRSNVRDENLVKKANGDLYEQASGDAKGYYISTTSILDRKKNDTNVTKWADAMTLPYFVLPGKFMSDRNIKLGCWGYIINSNNNRQASAFLCESGPNDKIGEGSHALAVKLGLPVNENESDKNSNNWLGKNIGTSDPIIDFYVFYDVGLGNGTIPTQEKIDEINPYGHYPDYLTFATIIEDAMAIKK